MWLGVQTPARAEGPVHRRTALRLARAAGHTAPVVQTVLQRFSLAGRGAGRQLEPRLVSTPSAAAAAAAHCQGVWRNM